jgi:tetratricopeptide (TPR) repeat protein
MTTKKRKFKSPHQIFSPDLLKVAEDQLQRGQIEEALSVLRRVETELKKYQSSSAAKKVSIPPHIVKAQIDLPLLLARALFEHSFTVADPKVKLAEIDEASRRAPGEVRYMLARGGCRLLLGEIDLAQSDFQLASKRWPGDEVATRAFTIVSAMSQGGFPGSDSSFTTPFSASLLEGLRELSVGNTGSSRPKLSSLPPLDRNPTRAEAASLTTQLFYHGAMLFAAQDFKAALSDFKEALRLSQLHSLHLPLRKRLHHYFHKIAERVFQSDKPTAIQCWQQAIALVPDDRIAAGNLAVVKRIQAQQAWSKGDLEQAAALWNDALLANPQDEQSLRNLAIVCEKLGQKKVAIQHWRALARLWRQQAKTRAGQPGFKERLIKLEQHIVTLMLEDGSDGQEIVHELESALRFDPDNHELRGRTVDLLLEVGKPKQALKHLESIEKQQGISVDLLVRKAEALSMSRRPSDARKTFERALELEPSSTIARRSYLLFLSQEADRADDNDDHRRSAAICQEQLSIDPNYEPAMIHLAVHYLRDGMLAEAKKMIDRVLAANPQSPQTHVKAGSIYLSADMEKEAEKLFKKAIELEPSGTCFFHIGMSYLNVCYHKESLKPFDKAAETADVEMLLDIASNLIEHGEGKNADRFLKKAMKLDPLNPMPHIIKAIGLIDKPFLNLPSLKNIQEAVREFAEAERLMVGREEYEDMLPDVQRVRKDFEKGPPPGIGSLFGRLGGEPFLDLDEIPDEDSIFSSPYKPKKKRRK